MAAGDLTAGELAEFGAFCQNNRAYGGTDAGHSLQAFILLLQDVTALHLLLNSRVCRHQALVEQRQHGLDILGNIRLRRLLQAVVFGSDHRGQ